MEMHVILGLALIGLLLLAGCTAVGAVTDELQTCMKKCSEVCDAAKAGNVSLDGYNVIGLEKKTGAVTVKCGCPCVE
jgi:hypothetical protein